jgi:hypothetical protein
MAELYLHLPSSGRSAYLIKYKNNFIITIFLSRDIKLTPLCDIIIEETLIICINTRNSILGTRECEIIYQTYPHSQSVK